MTVPRPATALTVLALLAVLCAWLAFAPSSTVEPSLPIAATPRDSHTAQQESGRLERNAPSPLRSEVVPPRPGEDYLRLAFQGVLHSKQEALGLTAEEITRLTDIFLEFQEARGTYEASLVERRSFDGRTLVLTVPPYLEAGARMRESFYDRVSSAVATERREKVLRELTDFWEDSLLAFGATEQRYEVQFAKPVPPTLLITREAKLTTNSPTDDLPDTPFVRTKQSWTVTMDQVVTGEYAAIGGQVRDAFFR